MIDLFFYFYFFNFQVFLKLQQDVDNVYHLAVMGDFGSFPEFCRKMAFVPFVERTLQGRERCHGHGDGSG